MGDRGGSGVDRFVGYAEPLAIALGFAGIPGTGLLGEHMLVCLVPAGTLIAVIGFLIATNRDGLADRLRERHPGALRLGFANPAADVSIGGALLTFIGLGWLALGIAGVIWVL